MSRDNISGAKGNNFIISIFLIPGKVIQWFMYMTVGSQKGYGKVVSKVVSYFLLVQSYFF